MRLDVGATVAAIASVLPELRPIEHHEPQINGLEVAYVRACLNNVTGYDYIKLMEKRLAEITGQQVLVVSSGTAALHLALMAAGVLPDDEVLVPSLTFAATANAVVHAGATPHFIDGSLNVNPYKLRCYLARETIKNPNRAGRINRRTEKPISALMVVHLLGEPADMTALEQLAGEFGLLLIEDAAEAVGSRVNNRACGSFGAASIFSFNNNKIVTTNGGGALLSSDEWVIAKAFQLATTARVPHKWEVKHDSAAWNYRMPNLCAALGVAQLDQLDHFLTRKRALSDRYKDALSDCQGLKFLTPSAGSNCWLSALLVNNPKDRDLLLAELHDEGIRARAIFTPLHKLPMYKDNPRDSMGYAEDTASRMVCLPSGAGL